MHAQKLPRAQTTLERSNRLSQDMRVAANMQADVIACRLGPINLGGFQADDLSVGLDDNALRDMLPRLGEPFLAYRLQQVVESVHLKRLHGIGVIGSDENGERQMMLRLQRR